MDIWISVNCFSGVLAKIFLRVVQYKRTSQSLQVVIHDIQVEPASSGSTQAAVVASATAVAPHRPAALRKGDKHSCVVQVQADAAGQDLPLGHLHIVWARAGYGCSLCRLQNAVMRLTLVKTFCLCLLVFSAYLPAYVGLVIAFCLPASCLLPVK